MNRVFSAAQSDPKKAQKRTRKSSKVNDAEVMTTDSDGLGSSDDYAQPAREIEVDSVSPTKKTRANKKS